LAPDTPQQNGVGERKNSTLIEMARTILDEYKTSDRFLAEAVNMACHATNRLYLHNLLKKTPYELLTSNKPNISYFRVFGTSAMFFKRYQSLLNLLLKVYDGFLLFYDSNLRAYHVFNKDSGRIETTCDAMFDETNDSQVDDKEAPCDAL
jgi:hypothetical protein